MTVRRMHIRGNTGTQILQAAVALASIQPDDEPILCVNSGGNLKYDGTNRLGDFFDAKCRIIDVDTSNKTPYWQEGAASLVFRNRDQIFKHLEPQMWLNSLTSMYKKFPDAAAAIHIRGGDKKICTPHTYHHLIELAGPNSVIYTDDHTYAYEIAPEHPIAVNSKMIEDWSSMYSSKHVYAAPSSFIMCMLLFNPDKRITFLGPERCTGEYDISGDMIFLNELLQFCPNVELI